MLAQEVAALTRVAVDSYSKFTYEGLVSLKSELETEVEGKKAALDVLISEHRDDSGTSLTKVEFDELARHRAEKLKAWKFCRDLVCC